jgi:phosphohistidine phosphatase
LKTLVVLRHAEAVSQPHDFGRPLSDLGYTQAGAAGRALRPVQPRFDLVLSSPAVRALSTAELVAAELGYAVRVQLEERLYEALADEYLGIVRALAETLDSVLLVAHNPSLSDLARRLLGEPISLGTAEYVTIRRSDSQWRNFGN